jgi:hypothetical protein
MSSSGKFSNDVIRISPEEGSASFVETLENFKTLVPKVLNRWRVHPLFLALTS